MAHSAKWIEATADELVTDVARRSLKARFRPVQRFMPLAAKKHEKDIEYVHQLRIWTRRAEAALQMYWELLPQWRAAWLEEQLRHIRKATNDARDDDVFAARLQSDQDDPAAARLLERVCQHRTDAQQAVVDVYDRLTRKDRFDRRITKLLKRVRLRGKKKKKAEPHFDEWAEQYLEVVADEFFEMSQHDLTDIESLHQFRIVGKRLRYVMELLSGAFASRLRKGVYPLLTTLQARLGKINDHASAQIRIRHWIDDGDEPAGIEYLRRILRNEDRKLAESRAEFLDWWSNKRRKQLQDALSRVLAGKTAKMTA